MSQKVINENSNINLVKPRYLKYTEIRPKEAFCNKRDMLDGLLIQEKGGLKCVNQVILDKQKGVVKSVLSQAASNVFSG